MPRIYLSLLVCFLLFSSNAQTTNPTCITDSTGLNTCDDETEADIRESIMLLHQRIENTDSADIHSFYFLGMAYYKLGLYDSAIIHFDYIIAQDSCYPAVLSNRAICKLLQGDKEGACEDWNRALPCKGPMKKDVKGYLREYCKD